MKSQLSLEPNETLVTRKIRVIRAIREKINSQIYPQSANAKGPIR